MAVYVDDLQIPYGRMRMCHMYADSLPELLAMADKIGVARKWLQGHPTLSLPQYRKAGWVHFDICLTKRAEAIRQGAIATDRYGASEFVAKQEGNQKMLDRIAHLRARSEAPLLL